MERIVEKRHFPSANIPQPKRVAAYARVSSGKDAMLHSLAAQVEYYSTYIHNHPGWQYAGVYADEALTGTKDNRENFQRLLADCRDGKVDMVITKSISRFARNTVTLLETVRELKNLSVDVFFEEQNIHSISSDGELMLTILASYAQEESLSASENQKWRIRHGFEEGIPWHWRTIGYRLVHGKYEVIPEEADIVKRIYAEYLEGKGFVAIAKGLNKESIPTRNGYQWTQTKIQKVLKNYIYTGNLLLQRTYSENHITKRKMVNNGELPMYHAEQTHEAIIPLATYEAVQREIADRAEHFNTNAPKTASPFTGKITCACCGKHYRRKKTATRAVWICTTFNTYGKAHCPTSKQIPEETLMELTEGMDINEILADGNLLTILLHNGTEVVKQWQDRSRADSWTPEMKAAARQKELERRAAQNGS